MAKDLEAAAIRTLPWVASVVKNTRNQWLKTGEHPGYTIKTKPGKLSVLVTNQVQVDTTEGHPYVGKPLKKSFKVPMGALRMNMSAYHGSVKIGMATKPKTIKGRFLPYPAWDGGGIKPENWDYQMTPCFGGYEAVYRQAENWYARAQVLAEYVQSAVPHRENARGGSVYAYLLGFMPEEHIVGVKELRKIRYFHVAEGEDGEDTWEDEDEDDEGCDCC